MSSEDIKRTLRLFYKEKRGDIPKSHRDIVESKVLELLYPKLVDFDLVLSFCSIGSEISTQLLNEKLSLEKRLVLPKVEGDTLKLYLVKNLENLKRSKLGILEPEKGVKEISLEKIGAILVPGLAFDSVFHRLGYGKGHYDRLLENNLVAATIGIGFKEQLCEDLLPVAKHDKKLDDVILF